MIGQSAAKLKYPNIVRRKQDIVANIFQTSPLNIMFRRSLLGQNLRDWNITVSSFSLTELNLQDSPDVFKWSLHSTGQFSVKSMYAVLVNNGVRTLQKIRRAKMLTKNKIFMWKEV